MSFSATKLIPQHGQCATKSYANKNGKLITESYPNIKHWNWEVITCASVRTLFTALSRHLNLQPALLIRGTAVDGLRRNGVRRLGSNFIDQGCNWVMIDVDDFELPDGIDPYSEEAIRYFINHHLPPEFRDVTCVASFSASAGIIDPATNSPIKVGLNVHLFFELSRSLDNHQVKFLLRGYPVDLALYTSVQPHYVMDPIICNGITCELPQRHLLIEGDKDVVEVPQDACTKPNAHGRSFQQAHDDEWEDPVGGLPGSHLMFACNFMRAFVRDEIHCEQRYLHARAFATNAYRSAGDSETLVRSGLDHNRPDGYIHTEQIISTITSTRPISCRYIVESGYDCPKYNEQLTCCKYSTSIYSPYSLALQLHRKGK